MQHLIYLISKFKYFALFPLAIIEGPILSVISGFLCTTGTLHPLITLPIIVLGDITGDSFYYVLGRWGSNYALPNFLSGFKPNAAKLDGARNFINANPKKAISLSKIVLGVGVAGIFLAGNARTPYVKFLIICLITSILQCTVYMGIGYFFGSAYEKINVYLGRFVSIGILAVASIGLFFFIRSIIKKK